MDNKEEFYHTFKQIFSQELKMKNENVNNYVKTLLDLNITVKEEQILTKLYDKSDGFPFFTVKLPYKYSYIPSKMIY